MSSLPFLSGKYKDGLTMVGISIYTAVLCKAIMWLLIYCTLHIPSLHHRSKKLESIKSTTPIPTPSVDLSSLRKSSKTKKIDRIETSFKESTRDLSHFKFKSGAVVPTVLFVHPEVLPNRP